MSIVLNDNGNKKEVFWENGEYLGWMYQESDGFYVFVTREDDGRVWSDYVLEEIAAQMKLLNAEWRKHLKEMGII